MTDAKKLLIVDDDQSLITMLKEYLPKAVKHQLFIAMTGEEALEIIEKERPDVILLDMQLPGIKGPQVLKTVRDKYPDTKVIVITSYDKQIKNIVADMGVDGFFPKPIIISDVVDRIEEVLKSKDATIVTPVALDDIKPKEGIIPEAKILFIEREFWMPYLLPIADTDQPQEFPIKAYGKYDFKAVYCQNHAMSALKSYRPDIVICATEVPVKERYGDESLSTADLVDKIMKSRYTPKAVIVHGVQQDINSFGTEKAAEDSGMWVEKKDMYNYRVEHDKENAERLNKMLWQICFKHNLIAETK